jgi:hypothetical protein
MCKINISYILQLLSLLMTSCATLIQMKNHPIILTLVNNTLNYYKRLVRHILLIGFSK